MRERVRSDRHLLHDLDRPHRDPQLANQAVGIELDQVRAHEVLAAARAASSLPLIIVGRSLGSACAAELARTIPAPAGLILESGFTDLHRLMRRRGLELGGPLSADDHAAFEPLHKLSASTVPLLVLDGALDTLIMPAEASVAHDAAGTTDKRLIFILDRGHNDISAHPLYWASLRSFLDHVTAG